MRVSYAIVFVSDMKRSVVFYRDVVGLPLKFDSPEWSEFATDGATFALHRARSGPAEAGPSQGNGESSQGNGEFSHGNGDDHTAGSCRPGLSVPDLDAFHARMLEHNVACIQQPKDLFGSKIAQYLDPDGLEISVSEERR